MSVFWILFSVTLNIFDGVYSRVTVQPSGPIIIAVGESATINCTLGDGIILVDWSVQFMDLSTVSVVPTNSPLPGVTAVGLSGLSMLTLNTSNTSITSVTCVGAQASPRKFLESRVCVTIYGVPDPPMNISLQLVANEVEVSWEYRIIQSVTVTFNLSLTFSQPSVLEKMTKNVTDLQNATFTLLGNRSCDPYRLCIAGRNTVGQGEVSCTVGSLPYMQTLDRIQYSLSKSNGNFALTVMIMIPEECHNSEQRYELVVRSVLNNDTLSSLPVLADQITMLQVGNLLESNLYVFTITSLNLIGKGRSEEVSFSTNCIQGITICSPEGGGFRLSCDYISGCEDIGCNYIITGDNITDIEGTISPNWFLLLSINISLYNSITVNNSNSNAGRQQLNFNSVESCSKSSTSLTVSPSASTPIAANAILVVAIVVPIIVAVLILAVIIIGIVCIYRKRTIMLTAQYSVKVQASREVPLHHQHRTNAANEYVDSDANGNQYYSDLNTLKLQSKSDNNNSAKTSPQQSQYAALHKEPVYHVLEKDTPTKENSQLDKPAADLDAQYAVISTRSAKKT